MTEKTKLVSVLWFQVTAASADQLKLLIGALGALMMVMLAPSGVCGVQSRPKAGQSFGFLRLAGCVPHLFHGVESSVCAAMKQPFQNETGDSISTLQPLR